MLTCSRQTLHELERELRVQIYPGTEIMTDVGSHHFLKSTAGAGVVLVPQPSDDEHDPLVSGACLCSLTQGSAINLELEHLLENFSHLLRNGKLFLSRTWSVSNRTDVPGPDRCIQFRPCGRYQLHRNLHYSPWVQQFHLVSIGVANMLSFQLLVAFV